MQVHIAGAEMEAGYPLTQPERYRLADEAVQKFYHDDRSRMHLVGQNMPFGQYYAARIPSRRLPRSRRPRDASAEPLPSPAGAPRDTVGTVTVAERRGIWISSVVTVFQQISTTTVT